MGGPGGRWGVASLRERPLKALACCPELWRSWRYPEAFSALTGAQGIVVPITPLGSSGASLSVVSWLVKENLASPIIWQC